MIFHRPEAYRYEVSAIARRRVPRFRLNHYGRQVIGVCLVAGRYAYCLKWAWAR